MIKITPFKVSTITATGRISSTVCLNTLFKEVQIISPDSTKDGIVYIQYGARDASDAPTPVRGIKPVKPGKRKPVVVVPGAKKKRFDNQATILFQFYGEDGVRKTVNAKVFSNGSVQMTGLKHVDAGMRFLNYLTRCYGNGELEVTAYNINLINSDFNCGIEIRRDIMGRILQEEYGVLCVFESCHYQGLKIQYFWNKDPALQGPDDVPGMCNCSLPCYGKGTGRGDGECKKITMSVFQSGSIIITGANKMDQVQEAYEFITRCVTENVDRIKHVQPMLPVRNNLLK